MRFCMVTTFYPPYHFGGDGVCVQRLAHALVRRGHSVDVIHDVDAFRLQHRGPLPQPCREPAGIRLHSLQSRWGSLSCLATQQTGRPVFHGPRIRRILEEGRFDVIHYHNISLVGGPRVLGYGEGIKLYTAHEHWLVCPTHVLWKHGREPCSARQCLQCQLRHRRPPQLWRSTGMLERELNHVDAFIAPSRFTAEKHREFGFSRPMHVIPHLLADGSDESAYVQADSPPPARPYFLFVGRLEKLKGLQDVIPHFQDSGFRIQGSGNLAGAGNPNPDLLIAGEGSYEGTLRQLADSSPRIRFLGRQDFDQLRDLYQHALAVVVPSLGYETFGVVVAEAFRQRTPVIARARGALTELVEQSGGGLLFETSGQLGFAMRTMCEEPALRSVLAENGYRTVTTEWSEDVVLARYFGLIQQVGYASAYPKRSKRFPMFGDMLKHNLLDHEQHELTNQHA